MQPRSVDVLTVAECAVVRERVHALRPHWSQKALLNPFFTLGVSAYLEAESAGAIAYTFAAKRQRSMMWDAFGETYTKMLAALATALDAPVELSTRLALPGFNIFLADAAFERPVCRIHIDLPYANVHWREWEQVDLTQTLSFTLAIALPKSGGGLRMWPTVEADLAPIGPSPASLVEGIEPTYVPYTVGGLVIHHGHTIHQIAPFSRVDEGDERITMQGHAILSAQGWLVYF